MKSFSRSRAAWLLAAVSTQAIAVANAQVAPGSNQPVKGQIEQVIVTAQKRKEDVMKAAASISVISGATVATQSLTTADDLLKNIPNVSTTQIGFGSTITIRGLGFDLPVTVGEGAVSTTFDGAFSNDVASTLFGYFDLDRVEVLRGPQGTLYGRNSTAGAVNVITADPSLNGYHGYGLFEIGNYNEFKEEAAVNVPVTDQIAARLAVSNINRDGYMSTGQEDQVGTGVRGKLLYKPVDYFQIVFLGDYDKLRGRGDDGNVTLANYLAGHPYLSTETSPNESERYHAYKLSFNANLTVGPGTFTLIPDYEKGINNSLAFNPFAQTLSVIPSTDEQKSVELRYASLPSSLIKWQVGAYYYDRSQDQGAPVAVLQNVNYGAGTKAVFGQATYPILPSLRLVGGIRYSHDSVTERNPNTPALNNAHAAFNIVNWKAGLEYDLTKNVLTYLTIASGSRPGGFNDPSSSVDFGYSFQPEHVIDYEVGAKAKLFDNRLQLTGALFYYDYKNYQAVDAYLNPVLGAFFVRFFNVDKASDYGAEFESTYLLTPDTRVNFALDLLHARYTSTFLEHANPFGPATNLDGTTLDHSPAYALHGSLDHTFYFADGSSLTPNVTGRLIDHQLVSPFPSEGSYAKGYAEVDGNLRYVFANPRLSLNAFLKNAAGTIYKASGNTNSVQAGPPRMYGVNVQYRF